MKSLLTILALFICMISTAQVRVTTDSKGNYVVAKKDSTTQTTGKPTDKTITDKDGKVYPVYESSRGKLYYMRTSKTGNVYKAYLKI